MAGNYNQRLNGKNHIAYIGNNAYQPSELYVSTRNPKETDIKYTLGSRWLNSLTEQLWYLGSYAEGGFPGKASWNLIAGGGGSVVTLTSDNGIATALAGNVNVLGGTGVTTTAAGSTLTVNHTGITVINYKSISSVDSPYPVVATDVYISVNTSTGGVTVRFPDVPTIGTIYYVKDRTGDAVANNITITSVSGAVLFDGATTFVINTAFESVSIMANATGYELF